MNTFVVQNLSSNKSRRFHNNPPMKYSPFGQSNMQRCPYHTVVPYGVDLPQSTKTLQENPQCSPRQVTLYSGFNVTNRNIFPYPINVLSEKVTGLYAPLIRQNQSVIAPTRKMLPPPTEFFFHGNNFTEPPLGSDTNHKRLLDVFHKNFNLLRPAIHAHDRKRKQTVLDDDVVVKNSRYILNGNNNKRPNPTYKSQNETNNAVKKNNDQMRYRTVIEEDRNGLLKVCYEPLSGNEDNVGSTRAGGSNNNSASSVANNDLDLTLHL